VAVPPPAARASRVASALFAGREDAVRGIIAAELLGAPLALRGSRSAAGFRGGLGE
jgi:hypothetical protein